MSLLVAACIYQFEFTGSNWIGEPISPESLSDTRLSICNFVPPYITIAVPKVAVVFDDANWSYDPKHHDPRGRMISVGLKLTM